MVFGFGGRKRSKGLEGNEIGGVGWRGMRGRWRVLDAGRSYALLSTAKQRNLGETVYKNCGGNSPASTW